MYLRVNIFYAFIPGYYIYTEASLSKPGDTARLVIENMSGQLCMQFFYHMHTTGVGKLYVEIFRKSQQRKSRVLWSKHGNQGFDWKKALVDLQGVSYMVRNGLIFKNYLLSLLITLLGKEIKWPCSHIAKASRGEQGFRSVRKIVRFIIKLT